LDMAGELSNQTAPCVECGRIVQLSQAAVDQVRACNRALEARGEKPMTRGDVRGMCMAPECVRAWRAKQADAAVRDQAQYDGLMDGLRSGVLTVANLPPEFLARNRKAVEAVIRERVAREMGQ